MADDPDRICGHQTESGRYCDKPYGDCPWHDADAITDDITGLLDNALDYADHDKYEYAMKFVRQARARIDTE